MKLTQNQIKELNELPPCKKCGDKVNTNNTDIIELVFDEIKAGAKSIINAVDDSTLYNIGYRDGWRDGMQQLANVLLVKYGGSDE
jgi:hypothetical protein